MNKSWQTRLPFNRKGYEPELENYDALPNVLRETFLQRNMGEVAMLLDATRFLRLKQDQWFTVNEIIDAVSQIGLSEKIIRKALNNRAVFRMAVETNGKVGRNKHLYQLPRLQRLFAEWVRPGDWYRCVVDVIPVQAFHSLSDYRAQLHRSLIQRLFTDHDAKPVNLTRQFMADRLGVTVSTIRNYEHRLGDIIVTQRFQYIELIYGEDWNLDPVRILKGGKPVWTGTFLIAEDTAGNHTRYPAVRAIAAVLLRSGYRVYKVKQLQNEYSIRTAYTVDEPKAKWISAS